MMGMRGGFCLFPVRKCGTLFRMKAAPLSRRILGAVKVETILIILVIGAVVWWQIDRNAKEKKRSQFSAMGKTLSELSNPKPSPDSLRLTAGVPKADDAECRGYVGHKVRVAHPGYFTELGGVPAYDSIEGGATFRFSELESATPGAELHPNEITKMSVRGSNLAHSKVTFLPVTTEFEILEGYRPSSLYILGNPLILKARAPGLDREHCYINARCLTPAQPH
jgi:hypothetical protein